MGWVKRWKLGWLLAIAACFLWWLTMGFQLEAGGTKRERRGSVGAEKIWIKVTFGRALLRLGPRKLYLF